MKRPAIFLDRDGVINLNRPEHVRSWEEFEFLPQALAGLQVLGEIGRPVIVATNQSVIGRGLTDRAAIDEIHARMVAAVAAAGGRIDLVCCCPHSPEDDCDCRKPRPGLLLTAAAEMDLDLGRSYLIGDAISDIDTAAAAGCRAILVLTGRGAEAMRALRQQGRNCAHVASDLLAAARWIRMKGDLG
jgi:D-glycero-D-manno-heptose 1,7-bisphosphate phosphatase